LQYVKAGHYDGLIFHRVIENFMIQTGGYKPDLTEKPTRPPIPLESRNGLSNLRGTVAMARTAIPDSATSQFFINTVDNVRLDQANAGDGEGYAVFGKVIEGLDVVDKIRVIPTRAAGPHQNLPTSPVTIRKASVEK
jgi:peptidyl-prolyl cis-trans isomerase A (cyclophilin A)